MNLFKPILNFNRIKKIYLARADMVTRVHAIWRCVRMHACLCVRMCVRESDKWAKASLMDLR